MTTNIIILDDPENGTTHEIQVEAYHVHTKRGRDRQLDEINAGTCVIRCRNYTGNFNPYFSETTDYLLLENGIDFLLQEDESKLILESGGVEGGAYGVLAPGRRVMILDEADEQYPVFVGYTDDFDYVWEPSKFTDVAISCIDGLGLLARQSFLEWSSTNGITSGAYVAEALARPEVDTSWAGATLIDDGLSTFQDVDVAYNTNVLSQLQTAARTEQGRLYVTVGGSLRFRDRNTLGMGGDELNPIQVTFADTGAVDTIPFQGIKVTYGSELLYNRVSVERIGGTVQSASDAAARGNTYERHLAYSGLLFDSDEQAEDLAYFLVGKFKDPAAFVSEIEVVLDKLSLADRGTVLLLDLGSAVALDWTPTAGGAAVNQTHIVEGIEYEAGTDMATTMRFQLSLASSAVGFILDSEAFGVLDESILGF